MDRYSLVLGTYNQKKRSELAAMLEPHGFDLKTLEEFPAAVEVEETGDSFAANAALKAAQQAQALNQWVLAEDSGLSVAALDGRPGIYSARYAGENATDDDNNQKLLEELKDVPDAKRGSMYVCHLSLADPSGEIRLTAEATCRGRIGHKLSGRHGFGYDPLFVIPEYHQTFGVLGSAVKSALSHRARAMRIFLPKLVRLTDQWNTSKG